MPRKSPEKHLAYMKQWRRKKGKKYFRQYMKQYRTRKAKSLDNTSTSMPTIEW